MTGDASRPKVFISYSWTTPQHEEWVLELAQRLSSDGVVVVLDKWDLREGQDKHVFMEQMVHDPQISKVLVICDRGYQAKADDRKGGVGTETQLISKKVYENTAQEKFIPIVREYGDDGQPCIPHFMASRIHIDLSSEGTFEGNYEKLLRNLFEKPLLRRPPVGIPPPYITSEDLPASKTSHKVRALKDAIFNDRRSANGLISDFLESVLSSLGDLQLSGGNTPGFDDRVADAIDKTLPLRNDFVDFASCLFKYRDRVDLEQLRDFFEKLGQFGFRPEHVQSWTEIDFDNFRFFNYELMLSFVAILLKANRFNEAAFFIRSQYFYRNSKDELRSAGIEMFNRHCESLDRIRNARLNLQRVSVTADLIKARATHESIGFADIRQADLILYYITEMKGQRLSWFPRTSVYVARGSGVDLFEKLVSRRHFEQTKALFGVTKPEELQTRISEYIARRDADGRLMAGNFWDYNIIALENVIVPQRIGSIE